MADWQSRIVGQGTEDPLQLVANPRNWRIHPKAQQQALASVLDEVGWVQQILVNKTTGNVVDGHLRVELALSKHEAEVPVLYVELTEAEEGLILASLDPIGSMAAADQDKMRELLAETQVADDELRALLQDLGGSFAVDTTDAPWLADGAEPGYQQMTFVLSNAQVEEVKAALSRAQAAGPFDSDNENRNGNALARIAESYGAG